MQRVSSGDLLNTTVLKMANNILKNRAVCFLSPFLLARPPMSKHIHHRNAKTTTPRARFKVEILTIGKRSGKDAVYDARVQEYAKRLSPTLAVSERVLKPEAALRTISELVDRSRTSVILLDEHGILPRDSVHFSNILFKALEEGGSRLAIVIGDAEGLPEEVIQLRGHRVQLVSLSPLTFTHIMSRRRSRGCGVQVRGNRFLGVAASLSALLEEDEGKRRRFPLGSLSEISTESGAKRTDFPEDGDRGGCTKIARCCTGGGISLAITSDSR